MQRKYISIENGFSAGEASPVDVPATTLNVDSPVANFKDADEKSPQSYEYEVKQRQDPAIYGQTQQQEKVLHDLVSRCIKSGVLPHSTQHRHLCRKAVTAASAFRDGARLFVGLLNENLRRVRKQDLLHN